VGRRARAALFAACALALLAIAAPASADTVTVSNTNDSGPGSLREVVDNAFPGDVVIVPAGTYTLTSDQIEISTGITVRGAGARRTIVQSDGDSRVFLVDATGPVTITDLTITGGDAGGTEGGGISAAGELTLDRVAVVGNRVNSDCSAPGGCGEGGGVYSNTPLTINRSLFAGNVGYNGGAFYTADDLTLRNSTVTNNTAGQATGTGNGYGGAGEIDADATVRGSTIVGNRDFGDTSGGGGFAFYGPSFSIRNSIVADNTSFINNDQPAGSAENPGFEHNCSGPLTDDGNNLEGATDCGFMASTSRQDAAPRLGPLADNGGQTDTMRLLPGSAALNRGASCEVSDQRGVPRTLGGVCDIGAYELVRCGGVAVDRVGTAGKDILRGTARADGILALAGNDLLLGLAGGDGLCGGKGRDRLRGGMGRDKLLGGPGRDRLLGGPGRDLLLGGPARDRLRGGPGPDFERQ
jgi:RTX calcium-binding nonapeptide repeat (4 copies)